jgi:GDPmannose 4,6-dehydratase
VAVALVTGVTGQDGSYLAERLLSEGHAVHGLVRSETAPHEQPVVPGVVVHHGDLADPGLWPALLAAAGPDEVYHLGGVSSVARSWADPVGTAEVTGMAAVRLLAAVQERADAGVPVRVLLASSAELFAGSGSVPQDESTPLRPTSPYGAAKAFAHVAAGVHRLRGLRASTVILYNHESPRRPPTFVTRKITMAAARIAGGDRAPLTLGNLEARRDWGWAPDYVDAMIRAVRHEVADDYVVATGRSHTVRDFVAAAFAAAGVDDWERHVRVDPTLVRVTDSAELRGDASRARDRLGWRPTVGFQDLVGRMVAADLRGDRRGSG